MQVSGRDALPVPVTIVAGFLGAGKTTLLNHILTSDHGRRIAVIVNDFGEINIDAELVSNVGEGMVSLANGCICCAIRSDLVSAVLDLCDAEPSPEHIVIESSGVADPNSVFRAFLQPELRQRILMDGVLTVVDGEQVLMLSGKERKLAEEQIEGSDLILLNKADLADEALLARTIEWVGGLNARAQTIATIQCNLPVAALLGANLRDDLGEPQTDLELRPEQHHHHGHDHEHAFESWAYSADKPLRLGRVSQVLDHLPREVFRAKGFIFAADNPDQRHLLQLVGRRAVLSSDRPWGGSPPKTRLVFIARHGACNIPAINKALDQCQAEQARHD